MLCWLSWLVDHQLLQKCSTAVHQVRKGGEGWVGTFGPYSNILWLSFKGLIGQFWKRMMRYGKLLEWRKEREVREMKEREKKKSRRWEQMNKWMKKGWRIKPVFFFQTLVTWKCFTCTDQRTRRQNGWRRCWRQKSDQLSVWQVCTFSLFVLSVYVV